MTSKEANEGVDIEDANIAIVLSGECSVRRARSGSGACSAGEKASAAVSSSS
ncbi:MAG: hypothetical protein U0235_11175 [Polyangiaceae bacterium]